MDINIGSIGNKTETSLYLFHSLLLIIPVAFGYFYLIVLQTYVLIFDVVLNAIGLVFLAIEVLMSISTIYKIKSHRTNFN